MMSFSITSGGMPEELILTNSSSNSPLSGSSSSPGSSRTCRRRWKPAPLPGSRWRHRPWGPPARGPGEDRPVNGELRRELGLGRSLALSLGVVLLLHARERRYRELWYAVVGAFVLVLPLVLVPALVLAWVPGSRSVRVLPAFRGAAAAGLWLGMRARTHISEAHYRRLLRWVMALFALLLILDYFMR